jgi:hypothetical protein
VLIILHLNSVVGGPESVEFRESVGQFQLRPLQCFVQFTGLVSLELLQDRLEIGEGGGTALGLLPGGAELQNGGVSLGGQDMQLLLQVCHSDPSLETGNQTMSLSSHETCSYNTSE